MEFSHHDSILPSRLRRTLRPPLSWAHAAETDFGIVLLHGKWDRPPTHVMVLSRQLEGAGYKVATPVMPWSGARNYDSSYGQALEEMEAAAKALRDKGATKIVIAGQSFGANGAIAYAASGRQVDGIVALSPAIRRNEAISAKH